MSSSPQIESARLVACPEAPWNHRVFLVNNGKRHYVLTPDHLTGLNLSLTDTLRVSQEEMRSFQSAGPLVRPIPPEFRLQAPPEADANLIREIATSTLRGHGVEFGAGTYPAPLPLDCQVEFADFLPEQEIRERNYIAQGEDFVRLSYVAGIEDPFVIPDDSQDFIVASHVIEHVRNPILAIQKVYQKLKPAGQFVMFVPNMRTTFDKDRELTSLDHLIEDFTHPDAERDALHFQDFWQQVYKAEISLDGACTAVEEGRDCHFHTFTYESFYSLIKWCTKHVAPWQSVWSHPGVADSFEFYFVLTK